ncbi:HAMP domain-containing sensor histidine kinase [Clostridium sp. JS66]|uniref:HAMP domain-containing sensor histidine kinase n=1 Tax=Clostridium sp. JS66 TaxID=3064705 RepID=UPI00298DCB84|nr:HAMP domain-containing sensor histidine kinase [Clostridium sp. JS66]WPC43663.1 HAMP domain-containing sensor histidine kinase [Clostridium sp. JS66]
MKSRSIKYNIITNFFFSGVQAFIVTMLIFVLGFGMLHVLSKSLYISFANAYNSDRTVMTIFTLVIFVIFICLMCFIFINKMNKITDYIEEISRVLNLVATGNMDVNIPIRRKDELGTLASDVNKMTYNLNELMKKEREWENHKNNLITNLSHDLRTPLTSILGFLELIEKYASSDEKLKHYCNISLEKAKKLKNSIDQLFEFTKINNADLQLNKTEISIEALIEQVTMGFIPVFEDNNMEYRITSKIKGLKINADPILLVRAFENIISNTIKYASKGKYLDIIIDKENDMAIVKFINYGEQIKQENLANLFNRFYRVEKSCDKREGTGLGLAIVKTIIELHSGEIKVTSSKEKTQFEFKLYINL